jgi:uncharacterized protein YutE (UPF0331/DUF86 family)
MIDDIDLNKAAIIRRCLKRISEEYRDNPSRLDDFTIQDSIVLNLLRACEAAIDLAMHRVAQGRFGIPQTSRDSFQLLAQNGILSHASATAMKHMVGFRNIAVHNYQNIQLPILQAIVEKHLVDFESYLGELSL